MDDDDDEEGGDEDRGDALDGERKARMIAHC